MRVKSAVLSLVLGAMACTRAAAPAETAGGGAAGAGGAATATAGGPRTLRKGESHEVTIAAGQEHEWGIDLAAGETVHLTIRAASAGAPPCTNWSWGFYNFNGGALQEVAMGPYNGEGGAWNANIDGRAEPSIAEGPMAGRYRVRVSADAASCPALRYTLRAE